MDFDQRSLAKSLVDGSAQCAPDSVVHNIIIAALPGW